MQLQFVKSALTVNPCMVSGVIVKQIFIGYGRNYLGSAVLINYGTLVTKA